MNEKAASPASLQAASLSGLPRESSRPDTPVRLQPHWFAAPLAATCYPFLLDAFHAARFAGSGALSALALVAALLVPPLALALAMRLAAADSLAGVLARRVALLAVATPPLYTLSGVVFMLLGPATWDAGFMTLLWVTLAAGIAIASRAPLAPRAADRQATRWRTAHGVAATVAVLFLAAHFSNHLFGWLGPEAHLAVMSVLRRVYRSAIVEPLLIGVFAFLIVTGARMAWRLTGRAMDRFRTFQVAGGVFLVFAIVSHVTAVLYLGRIHFRIETDWGFAVGAPTGMLDDPWNIRLLPYYLLAAFFAVAHAFAGLRIVMLAHGAPAAKANRVLYTGIVFAALLAMAIILAMAGMRLR